MQKAAVAIAALVAVAFGSLAWAGRAAAAPHGAPVDEVSLQTAGVGQGAVLLACSPEGTVHPVRFAGRPGDGIDVRGTLATDGTVLALEMEVDDVEFQVRFRSGQIRLQGQILQVRGPVVVVLTAGNVTYNVRFAAGSGDIVEVSGYMRGTLIEATEMEVEGHTEGARCIGRAS